MRILVQNCTTGDFLTESGEWSPSPAQARSFGSSGQAVSFCVKQQCGDVQVVLKFERDDLDVKLPLSPICKQPGLHESPA